MSDALQALIAANTTKPNPYPITSRYFGVAMAALVLPGGKTVVYLRRRFVPAPERFQLLQFHSVTEGERLDNITARYLADPEQFWRICDANNAMRPEELTETVGRQIRITLPEGITGPTL
jgi:hypothetical protein